MLCDGRSKTNVQAQSKFMVTTVYIMRSAGLRDEKSKAISQVPKWDFHSWLVRQSLAPLIDPSLIKEAEPCLGPST